MIRFTVLTLAVLLAACSISTGPKPHDPTALLVNRGPADARDSLIVTWVACPSTGTCSAPEIARFFALPGDSICTHFEPVRNPPSALQVQVYHFDTNTTVPVDTIRTQVQNFGPNPNDTFWKVTYISASTTGGGVAVDQQNTPPC